ncbi:MAG: hypothetical protein KGL00_09710 [Gammaproteobacteria bacterium]|nr:hypothetical protein [Gammaproteobacteria bacterium]
MYAIAAWVLLQLANSVFPDLGWPRQSVLILITAVALLFPVVLVLGWMFIPPSKDNPAKYSRWQHLRWRLGSVLTLLIVVLVTLSGGYLWKINTRHLNAENVAAKVSVPAENAFLPDSVAVLPFANLSGDPRNQYFSDGISEEILNTLSQIPRLNVIGRTSSFQFRDADVDAQKVGKILRVGTLLSGSVQRVGNEVRITAELVNTQTGVQLWSQQYDRKLTNIFAIEDEISQAIASTLQLKFAAGTIPPVTGKTDNPEAHRLYLLGLTKIAARGPALREAVSALQQAVKLDPNYAQAWGALAEAEILLPAYNLDSNDAALPRAAAAAQRALAIDANTASAYVVLGMLHAARSQWAEADQSFRLALTLTPNDVEAMNQYAQFLLDAGQLELALREIDDAQQLDPLSGGVGITRAFNLLALHRYDEARVQINRMLAAYPDFVLAHRVAAAIDIARHRYPQAEAQARIAAKLSGEDPDAAALLVRGIADPAQRAAAVRSLEPVSSLRGLQVIRAMYLAWLGEPDRALAALKICAAKNNCEFQRALWTPAFDPLRNDPRFKAVLKKMGLPYNPPIPAVPQGSA